MSASIKGTALVAALLLIATGARSDGIGSFNNGAGIFGGMWGAGKVTVTPPVSGALLLEDGSSILLLEDGSSDLCLEGGC